MCMTPCISQLTKTQNKQSKINSVNMQTQHGGANCGLFAIAVATSLGYGDLESGNLTIFPAVAT